MKLDGSYLYDRVLPLVDYNGDIRRGDGTYSNTFSPNNIKRLIISPERVDVFYHIAVKGRLSSSVMLNPEVVRQVTSRDDYKPVMSVLYADRICASIEEIIILSKGNCFSNQDMDFQSMIKGYTRVSGDIREMIKQRYKRFRAFCVIDMSYNEFINAVKNSGKFECICDLDFVKNGNIVSFNTDADWYKNYGSTGQFYILDRAGSPLNNHFKELIEKHEKSAKDDAIAKMRKERLGGLTEEWEKYFKEYKSAIKAYATVAGILTKQPSCTFKGYSFKQLEIPEKKVPNSKEELSSDIEKFKATFAELYIDLYTAYHVSLENCKDNEYLYEVMKYSFNTNMRVPPQYGEGGNAGKIQSFCIVCMNLVIGFARKTDGKDISKYCELDKWQEVFS